MGKKLTTDEWIKKAQKVHKNKYDYTKVNYINSQTKVCIICPEHGEFWQRPASHLQGNGCKKCANNVTKDSSRMTTEQFIEKACKIHHNKYDYTKVDYVNTETPVHIICKTCGCEFDQTPHNHLKGSGCKRCFDTEKRGKSQLLTTEQFIDKAQDVHGDKYDYSKVRYISANIPVTIICHKKDSNCNEHGKFLQTPGGHLYGQGCPICNNSSLEREVESLLTEMGIDFIREYTIKTSSKKKQRLDFYLNDKQIAIECQGIQHFEPLEFFGGIKSFNENVHRDKIKKEWCEKNNIKLIYYSHEEKYCNINTLEQLKIELGK